MMRQVKLRELNRQVQLKYFDRISPELDIQILTFQRNGRIHLWRWPERDIDGILFDLYSCKISYERLPIGSQ